MWRPAHGRARRDGPCADRSAHGRIPARSRTGADLLHVQPRLPRHVSYSLSLHDPQAWHHEQAEAAMASASAMLNAAGVPHHRRWGPKSAASPSTWRPPHREALHHPVRDRAVAHDPHLADTLARCGSQRTQARCVVPFKLASTMPCSTRRMSVGSRRRASTYARSIPRQRYRARDSASCLDKFSSLRRGNQAASRRATQHVSMTADASLSPTRPRVRFTRRLATVPQTS
jgi:hypothetical protein